MSKWVALVLLGCIGAKADVHWLFIPFAMTSPEYGVAFGAKARGRNLLGGSGYGDMTALYTTKGQWKAVATGLRDSIDGAWRLGGRLEGGVFPEMYGGIGSPSPKEALALYSPTYGTISAYAGRWLPGGVRIDLGMKFDRRSIVYDDTVGAFAGWNHRNPGPVTASRDLHPTFELEWNHLDHPEDPHEGMTVTAHVEPGVVSDWSLMRFQSTFVRTPLSWGPIVALRLWHEQVFGEVPFWEVPEAGNSDVLRGVDNHRVRDRAVQVAGLELRQPLELLGYDLELTTFCEAAHAGEADEVWGTAPVYGFGGGMRLLLDERHAVLRGDLGWNTASDASLFPSIYIDFGQAF